MDRLMSEQGTITGLQHLINDVPHCSQFAQYYLSNIVFQLLTAVVIVVMNTSMKEVMWMLTKIESHHTHSSFITSVTKKIFFAQVCTVCMSRQVKWADVLTGFVGRD